MFFGLSVPTDVDEETQALGIPRVNTTNGPPDHFTVGDYIIPIKPKIYPLSRLPYPQDVEVGDHILLDAACLSGHGKAVLPLEFWSDGEVLVPYNEPICYAKYGSYASPAGSLVQAATPAEAVFFGANSWHKIPKEIMYSGLGVRIRAKFFKNDADAGTTTFRLRLGQTSSGASGDIVAAMTEAAAAHEIMFDVVVRINVLGDLTVAQFTTSGVQKLVTSDTKTNNAAADRKTGFSTTADNYVTLSSVAANGNSGAAVLYFSISLVP